MRDVARVHKAHALARKDWRYYRPARKLHCAPVIIS